MNRFVRIPIEYKGDFEADPSQAWQSYGDSPQEAEFPYFEDKAALHAIVNRNRLNPFDDETFTFDSSFVCEDDNLRFIHIDYSLNRNATGIAMCHVSHWVDVPVSIRDPLNPRLKTEERPFFKFDFLARIVAKQGEDIQFESIRDILYSLDERGFPIHLVTFDRFQSEDSIQILRRKGFICAHLSLDRTSNYPMVFVGEKNGFKKISTGNSKWSTMAAWSCMKAAINTSRMEVPFYLPISDTTLQGSVNPVNFDDRGNKLRQPDYITWLEHEALAASFDNKKMKIVEPPRGSIDLLEAVAGACFNANNNVTDVPYIESGQDRRQRLAKDLAGARTEDERKAVEEDMGENEIDLSFENEEFKDEIEW